MPDDLIGPGLTISASLRYTVPIMILVLHIIVALSSIIFTGVAAWRPSYGKLHVAYGLAGATLATGSYLVVTTPSHLVQACISGLIYFAIVGSVIAVTRTKLTAVNR